MIRRRRAPDRRSREPASTPIRPGTAGGPFVYGQVGVVLAVLVSHPAWGVIALPLLARLYIRRKDLARFDTEHRPAFATKLEMAVDRMKWVQSWLFMPGKPLGVVADGASAKATFLRPMIGLGVVVVSRLRKDSARWTLPEPRPAGRRGRRRIDGERRIDLTKRAGQRRGWVRGDFVRYGKATPKRYQTFVATWRPAAGVGSPARESAAGTPRTARPTARPAPRGQRPQGGRS